MHFQMNIGDAVLTCSEHDAERAEARDRKAARRFPPLDDEQPGEVDAFCAALTGVPSFDYAIARAVLPLLPLPKGFRHFRLFSPGEREPFHRTMVVADPAARITSRTVLHGVLSGPCMEVTAWSTTTRRPATIPGVLDLQMDVDLKEVFRPLRVRE